MEVAWLCGKQVVPELSWEREGGLDLSAIDPVSLTKQEKFTFVLPLALPQNFKAGTGRGGGQEE